MRGQAQETGAEGYSPPRNADRVARTRNEHSSGVLSHLDLLCGRYTLRVYSTRLMPTFYDRFLECAERWPNNVALELQRHDQVESCTYDELRRMAESVGRWIAEQGFARGSRLAIMADNHPRWVAAYLGIIASGCAAVPLDTALHDDQVTKLLKDSGTAALFCDAKHLPVLRSAANELKLGLVLIDPESMTDQSQQERWLGTLPA